jgi:hypothetical protein
VLELAPLMLTPPGIIADCVILGVQLGQHGLGMFDELALTQDHVGDGLIHDARVQEGAAVVGLAMCVAVVTEIASTRSHSGRRHTQWDIMPRAPQQATQQLGVGASHPASGGGTTTVIREDLLGEHERFLLDDRRVVVGVHRVLPATVLDIQVAG